MNIKNWKINKYLQKNILSILILILFVFIFLFSFFNLNFLTTLNSYTFGLIFGYFYIIFFIFVFCLYIHKKFYELNFKFYFLKITFAQLFSLAFAIWIFITLNKFIWDHNKLNIYSENWSTAFEFWFQDFKINHFLENQNNMLPNQFHDGFLSIFIVSFLTWLFSYWFVYIIFLIYFIWQLYIIFMPLKYISKFILIKYWTIHFWYFVIKFKSKYQK